MPNNMEQMKKIIEEKKKKSSQQGGNNSSPSKVNGTFGKGFKNTKKTGSLNK
nr:hypothetical protein [Tissierella sp.]